MGDGETKPETDGDGEKDSDGRRMNVGEGLGEAVAWTNGGRVGGNVGPPIRPPSPGSVGGDER
jgi:hypothetical protein